MTDFSQRLAALSPEQRALFEQLQREKSSRRAASTAMVAIPQRPVNRPLRLSVDQERLWFVQQMAPASAAYNIAIAWQFQGELSVTALHRSLNTIVQRHESLRSCVTVDQGQPIQQIVSGWHLIIPLLDLRTLPMAQANQEGDRLAEQEARQPFDLSQVPLMRATLIWRTEQDWTLLLTLHHLIADGWSRGVLLREFMQCYRAIVQGAPIDLPALPIQYGDYAQWQRQIWKSSTQQDSLSTAGEKSNQGKSNPRAAYWQQQLANLAVLELPTDFPRPAIAGGAGATVAVMLPIALLNAVKAIARQTGVTVFMVLLAAFNLLLHRYTEQTDIAIGVPVANRDRPEVEGLIGFFVNTLVLRSRWSGDPLFTDWLKQIQQVTADAFTHQEVPFSQVVEWVQPDRHLSHNPLFQVMFQFQNQAYQLQNALTPELQLPGVQLIQTWRELGSTKFDLTWHLIEQVDGIQAVVEYRIDLFRAETVARLVQHFQVLLEQIIQTPHQPLSRFSLLTLAETEQLLAWGQGAVDPSLLTPLLHQQFESQAARTPAAIAVVFGEQSLTYAALNHQANQLAWALRSRGVNTETLVGVYLERSPLLLVALLAVLKAGGAYVPLDVTLGRDRLAFLLADAQPQWILTTMGRANSLSAPIASVLCLDDDRVFANQRDCNPELPLTGEQLAYVIYTSGSTGTPKGTLLTHQGLANYLNWCCQHYEVAQGNGAPVQSAIGFDATITSLYASLLVGRTVYLLPETDEILALRDSLQTQPDLSLVKLTPAHLEALSYILPQETNPHAPRSLIIGGEALTASHLAFWRTYAPQTRLINEYGPTETVVGCCIYEATWPDSPTVPIGRPIANTQLYVLDRHFQPVPIGVPGELYIGGAGVARGYLNRPALTAERFMPMPEFFQQRSPLPTASPLNKGRASEVEVLVKGDLGGSKGRLYKTGDRVRWRSDGNLEYLGRLDQQVKIRGFRVELGEVEAVLSQHPAIAQAVIICHSDPPHRPCLVAYLIAATQPQPAIAELRTFLAAKLPDYMHPVHWVWLEQLPLTVNGKIDRAALPAPQLNSAAIDQTAPQTAAERVLVQIWNELLGTSVGIHSNFFELGGDSILSLQVIARANQAGLHLTPKQLFQYQTIAQLAAIATPLTDSDSRTMVEVTGTVPLTPIQHWLLEQNLHNLDHYNQAMMLHVAPGLNTHHLNQALQFLWQYHDALRLQLTQTETGWQQQYGFSLQPPRIIEIDLTAIPASEQFNAIAQVVTRLQASLNLATGDLIRFARFRLGDSQPDRLLWIIHHWAVDGVSWRILWADLAQTYEQLAAGQAMQQLPPKTGSFQIWAQHLIQDAHSDTIAAEQGYWLSRTTRPCPPLPLDHPYSIHLNTVAATAELTLSLSQEKTQALLTEVPKIYRTRIDEVLLTALVQSLAPWVGTSQICVDLEHYGRAAIAADLDLTRTVGWFTTLYPALLNLPNIHDPGASLKSIKEQLRSIPHHGLGYGLWRYLRTDAELSPMPQADIRFNYLGQMDQLPLPNFSLGVTPESAHGLQDPRNHRPHLLVLNTLIQHQKLQMCWQYSFHLHDRATIKQLAEHFINALSILIHHCQSADSGGLTPSDVSGARLNQVQLDQFLAKIQSKP
jgi:amino acid adenylation domain-containing protein/non-ribosomal peptide synthase protein (TIGR01720 family)